MTNSKKPGVAFWMTVGLVVVLLGYPLSFGPWCWIASCSSSLAASSVVSPFYNPMLSAWYNGPVPIKNSIKWFANLGAVGRVRIGKRAEPIFNDEVYSLLLLNY